VLDLPLVTPSILAVLGAILSWLAARYWYMRAADKELRARVAELERQQGLTNLVAQPMWAAVQERLIKELTHFHTPVMDALLVKLGPPVTLTEAEEGQLEYALRQRAVDLDDQIGLEERDAARMLPMVMRRVKAEAGAPSRSTTLQVVAVPVAEEPPVEDGTLPPPPRAAS